MKKLLVLLLALITVLTMVACGNTNETTLPADDATDPVVTEPVETEPVETEPVVTEPVETEPVETEPVETEPAETESTDAEADLPACTCENENLSNISVQTTDTGLVYKCKRCGGVARTIVIGEGPIYKLDRKETNGSTTLGGDSVLNAYKGKIFSTAIGDKFYLTYNVNASDFTGMTDGKITSLISWKNSSETSDSKQTVWGHLIRIKNEGGVYRIVIGESAVTEAVMELNRDYSFVFEFEYTVDDTSNPEYVQKRAACCVYMDGEYVGKTLVPFERSERPKFTIRLNGAANTVVTYTDFKLYKPEIDN